MKTSKLLKRKKSLKYDPEIPRKFYVNGKLPPDAQEETPPHYVDNRIKTSKYTVVNFIPKNLFEQFRRIANFYFLCLCIIHFSINSPVSPVTSLLPLLYVITVTGIKQGYEDWKRHREDNSVNRIPAKVLIDGEWQEVERYHIKVGDIVKISANEEFPCDLLLLASSDPKFKCEVTTANLDGETNLKTFFCPFDLFDLSDGKAEEDIEEFSAQVECQHPNTNLYDFKGRLESFVEGEAPLIYSLATDNLLLRGATLKNTDFIYGCAVYTGKETKMALNSKMTISKFSTAERTCNYFLLIYLAVVVLEVFITTLVKYQAFGAEKSEAMWYLGPISVSVSFKSICQDSFSFFILYSYIIPISLYVTLEIQKFLGSFFFQWDEDMKSEETGEFAICNTSDLNEELGQVKYLFTDKTGTLTENLMFFRQCSVAGVKLTSENDQLNSRDNESVDPIPGNLENLLESFLTTLALCHTVQAKKVFSKESKDDHEEENGVINKGLQEEFETIPLTDFTWEYHASSPDEKALVEACALYGVVFEGEDNGFVTLSIQGKPIKFEVLEILEFDSDRKLMSVIARDSEGEIKVLSKGAETSVFRRCNIRAEDEPLHEITMKHIDDFARSGLRTLAVAQKILNESEYEKLSKKLTIAKQEIENRESAVRTVMDEIENGLTLLGATAVEDLLQDGVQETLESLSVAGIKVWVLTGDKVETAVNIAYLCGLFKRFMSLIHLTHLNEPAAIEMKLEESKKELENRNSNYGLVVDGSSLHLLLEEFQEEFFQVCSQCSAVICCRMSPKQKAEIVRLVKSSSSKRSVCAAVGDGANDVSMIQEAHIGLGIMGKEGRQAVRCSDFALARFRFLQKALLVHGNWYYTRISTVILYCFYKNVAFITPQIFFNFDSAFSTQSVYEGLVLTLINVTFTGLPIIIFGLTEQNHSAEELLRKPQLYREIRNNRNMSFSVFFMWTVLGVWHAAVTYFGLRAATDTTPYIGGGKNQDLFLFGMLLTTIVILVINIKLMVESSFQTMIFIGSVLLTIVGFYLTYLIYCAAFEVFGIFWTFYVMHTTPLFYFITLLLMVTCLLPDILIKIFTNTKRFSLRDVLKQYFHCKVA